MPDSQVVSFTKPTIAVTTTSILILGAFAFWYDRGESDAVTTNDITTQVSSNTYRNDLQDVKISEIDKEVKWTKEEINKEKIARAQILGVINATAGDVREIRRAQSVADERATRVETYLMQYDFGPKKKDK